MIIDFITYNYTNILLFTVLLNIFNLNNKRYHKWNFEEAILKIKKY